MTTDDKITGLYHFTTFWHAKAIEETMVIKTTESNIGSPYEQFPPYGEHYAPDVVWLSDDPYASARSAGLDAIVPKNNVRFEVELPAEDVMWWPDFRDLHSMHPRWQWAMEHGRNPNSWFVALRPIKAREIVSTFYKVTT